MKKNKVKNKRKININAIKGMAIASLLVIGESMPAHASVVQISGMNDVATTLQNFVKYIGVFFMGAGALTAFYGAYKLFQSIKSQDSESRSSSIMEVACGVAAIAVGAAASTFSGYIHS